MKNIHIIWIVLSLMMIGCKKNVSLENGDVIMIDVAKDGYSQKEIILQDFMDVEYIALDSSDDFFMPRAGSCCGCENYSSKKRYSRWGHLPF
ncbi:hypothetical protein ACMSD6_17750 [Bacteroides thetaiotaomicron]|uniref:hypothetical protein n=1 Tax=Bacteroides thetaiotaomicron TaxID=818 RepID=UPI0039C26222